MNAALAMHGPDGGGVWSEGHVGLGQRLMCFTPEDRLERQPLRGGEGNYTLVLDGRVDNRPELAEALGISAAEAREMPDSAFILRAYEKWGAECCGRLIGDFAFALYDRRDERLVVAKSAMSQRPIYYREAAGRFAFSSAPKGLFALPWVPRAIDHQSLADYLVWAPRDPGRSLFAGVSELLGGHILVICGESTTLREHWQPSCREIRFARDSEYLEAFNELFDRVVGDYLRSITPVGIMLSGGLDSSSVAATAARLLGRQGKRLTAFTEVPRAGFDACLGPNRYADETPLVEALGRRYENIDLNFVRTEGGLLLDGIEQYLEAVEGPFRADWNRIWFEAILRLAASRNVRVLLTGARGNFTISREGERIFSELIRRGQWLRAYREARAFTGRQEKDSAAAILARAGARLLPGPIWHIATRVLRPSFHAGAPPGLKGSAIRPEFARLHRVTERARKNGDGSNTYPGPVNRARRYAQARRWGSAHLSTLGYEALLGVQRRDPPGDARVLEFCISLPEDQNFRNGVPRSLIRRAMTGRLPEEIVTNPRRGLQAADWLESAKEGQSQMLDELTCLERSELVRSAMDLRQLRRMLERLLSAESASVSDRSMLGTAITAGRFVRWFESPGCPQ